MDPEAFSASLFKWDPRGAMPPPTRLLEAAVTPPPPPPPALPLSAAYSIRTRELGGLEELFQAYGIRYYTAAKIAELGFTVNTLLDMKDEELDDMMNSLSQIFRWELLVGERYGIKAAIRAERRRLEEEELRRRGHLLSDGGTNALDALSQEGLSEEPVQQQEREAVGSGGGGTTWEVVTAAGGGRMKQRRRKKVVAAGRERRGGASAEEDEETEEGQEDEWNINDAGGGLSERQREHPFIVTEPGEVARGKKNGLDYLFHLYEQCRDFLIQVQNIAKERGEKCPTKVVVVGKRLGVKMNVGSEDLVNWVKETISCPEEKSTAKVTNQVFRYAKKAGASYINKPKMRHYVHCYALHCLDEEASNALRRAFKERGENVGAWRQACYKPLVAIAARQGWDIDTIFNAHPRLAIWYVPTKLRQLCHSERSNAAAASSSVSGGGGDHLPHF